MKKIFKSFIFAIVCICSLLAHATSTIYRDSLGRRQGTASTDRYGKTTYRDAQGRIIGTSTVDRYGKTTYRDAQGRVQGTTK